MRRLKLFGIASKFITRNFSSNANYVRGGRHSLINHTRLCSYRYVSGIAPKPVVDDGVFTFSPFIRFFHATGSLYSNERNYYDILGVSKDADRDEIKKSFHKLAKKYHPDFNKNNPSAKKKFQEISVAYETLQDPDKRLVYNMTLKLIKALPSLRKNMRRFILLLFTLFCCYLVYVWSKFSRR